jgi:hypothetical protein
MCWDVDIVHRPDRKLVDADYWSRLGIDIKFDTLFYEYIKFTCQLWTSNPAPTDLPMCPKNMPYYRGPCFHKPTPEGTAANTMHVQGLLTDIATSTGWGHTHLLNILIRFRELKPAVLAATLSQTLLNSELACYACQAMQFDWAVYSFLNGHISSSIKSCNLPFTIHLACNTTKAGRSLFHEFATDAKVFSSGNNLLNHICASGEQSVINSYLINSYHFQTNEVTSAFWKLQLLIITQLHLIRSLSIAVTIIIIIPDHDGRAVKSFTKGLEAAHWKVTSQAVYYLDIGDSISDSCSIITAVHSSCTSNAEPLVLKSPPTVTLPHISSYVWVPFGRPEHALGYGKDNVDFNKYDECQMTASTPMTAKNSASPRVAIKYYLHCNGHDTTILAGSLVLLRESVCPPFESCPNQNLFQQFFGIEFHHDGHTYVQAISTYKFARCFNLVERPVLHVPREVQIWTRCRYARPHIGLALQACPLPSCVPTQFKQ